MDVGIVFLFFKFRFCFLWEQPDCFPQVGQLSSESLQRCRATWKRVPDKVDLPRICAQLYEPITTMSEQARADTSCAIDHYFTTTYAVQISTVCGINRKMVEAVVGERWTWLILGICKWGRETQYAANSCFGLVDIVKSDTLFLYSLSRKPPSIWSSVNHPLKDSVRTSPAIAVARIHFNGSVAPSKQDFAMNNFRCSTERPGRCRTKCKAV